VNPIIKTLATKADMANVRREMGEIKADTIKWMFVFWIGQVGATLAMVLLFFLK
jgi:hypothetical protein